MGSSATLLPILAFLVASGAALDALTLKRQKSALYSRLVDFWYRVSTSGPAEWYDGAVHASKTALGIQEQRMRIRPFVGRVAVFSLAATTAAVIVGSFARPLLPAAPEHVSIQVFATANQHVINLMFDLASFAIGAAILRLLLLHGKAVSLLLVFVQALVALLLSAYCLALLVTFDALHLRAVEWPELTERTPIASERPDVLMAVAVVRREMPGELAAYMNWNDTLRYVHDTRFSVAAGLEFAPVGMLRFLRTGRIEWPASKWIEVAENRTNTALYRAELDIDQVVSPRAGLLALTNAVPWALFASVYLFLMAAALVQRISRTGVAWVLEVMAGDSPERTPDRFMPFTKLSLLVGLLLGLLRLVIPGR